MLRTWPQDSQEPLSIWNTKKTWISLFLWLYVIYKSFILSIYNNISFHIILCTVLTIDQLGLGYVRFWWWTIVSARFNFSALSLCWVDGWLLHVIISSSNMYNGIYRWNVAPSYIYHIDVLVHSRLIFINKYFIMFTCF